MKEYNTDPILSSPGDAAQYLDRILGEPGWGIINVGLHELQHFVPYFKQGWDRDIISEFAKILITSKNKIGNSFDIITALSPESYLIITQDIELLKWEQELNNNFISLVLKKMPHKEYNTGLVIVLNDKVFPLPSLVLGIVRAKDKTFSKPVDVYQTVLDNRKKNNRQNLAFKLHTLLLVQSKIEEELSIYKANPDLHSMVLMFASLTTGHLHDIRNGLNILAEQYPGDLHNNRETYKSTQNPIRIINYLLETISEIRFRGTGTMERVEINNLIINDVDSFRIHFHYPIKIMETEQPIMIYTKSTDFSLALFTLFSLLEKILKGKSMVTVSTGTNEKQGFVKISNIGLHSCADIFTDSSIQYEISDYWPYLYIFHKIIKRLKGKVEIHNTDIFIYLPLYTYQDILSLHSIKKQIDEIQKNINTLSLSISNKEKKQVDGGLITKTMECAGPLLLLFIDRLENYKQKIAELRPPPGKTENIIEIILSGTEYCSLLAANLLSLKGQYIKTTVKTNVRKVLTQVESILHYKISKVIDFELSIKENISDVHATETALAQVIMNLVMNSLEELSREIPPISRLYISVHEEDEYVVIKITDTGTGIPDAIINRIISNTQDLYHEKEGIGLYVVKSIIDSFGGQLDFNVQSKRGTTVSLFLRKWEDTT